MSTTRDADEIKQAVRERYAKLAEGAQSSCCGPASKAAESSCGCSKPAVSDSGRKGRLERIYSKDELESLPDTVVEAAAGCGNPTAIANLKPGEVVVDLGSGGGIDCFLAAQKVGPSGRVIGVDMTPEMIKLARENAKKVGIDNVEFRLGELEHLPVQDASADIIISNCVINLSPDKDIVFAEAFRILKPGGRMSVSDIVFEEEPTDQVRQDLAAWTGCVGGALVESDYLGKIRAVGFSDIEVASKTWREFSGNKLASVKVVATKPA